MSDRDDRRARQANEQQPTIPDGGLNSSMPAWLTERPRWADTPTKETPPPVKQLPPPDTSPIELSSILDVNDLPGWLQDVARRAEQRDTVVPSKLVTESEPEVAAEPVVDAEVQVQAVARQPEPPREFVAEELEPAESEPVVEYRAGNEAGTPEPANDAEDEPQSRVDVDVEAERPTLDVVESASVASNRIADPSPDGIGGQRASVKGQPVDWAAVRREAAASDTESLPASNSLLAKNPPVRVDPLAARGRSRRSRSSQDRPWWMSDAAIGVLLVAFILTMIYVILVTSGVL